MITSRLLGGWPLPQPDDDGDKEDRGVALVVGGSTELPGAALLAAAAALRAGAGKIRIATVRSVAASLGVALPEARVFSLPETRTGAIAPDAAEEIVQLAGRAGATMIGPGMTDEGAAVELVRALLPALPGAALVLDAAALACLGADPNILRGLRCRAILTPHAGEMASMLRCDKDAVIRDPLATARQAAEAWRAVVVLKGADTAIASPEGSLYRNTSGNVGLATSGSGDTLAGIIGGLAARGADPLQAAVWGVYLHGRAGDRLARRVGPLGFLARELLDEIPSLTADRGKRERRRSR